MKASIFWILFLSFFSVEPCRSQAHTTQEEVIRFKNLLIYKYKNTKNNEAYAPQKVFEYKSSALVATNIKEAMDKLKKEIALKTSIEHPDQETYYMLPFSYEADNKHPFSAHTFYTFVKVSPSGEQSWTTISWMPADFDKTRRIEIFDTIAEAARGNKFPAVDGKNYSLEETLGFANDAKLKVQITKSYNGIIRISKELYDLEINRFNELNEGKTKYLAQDFETRFLEPGSKAINCMHAVSDLPGYYSPKGSFGTGWGIWGQNGTLHVLNHLANHKNGWLYDSVESSYLNPIAIQIKN
jgi:hypothetical protein